MQGLIEKTPRREVADRLASAIISLGMNRPFGGEVQRATDKRTYDILFTLPGTCDGMVRVFSPNFILIIAAGPACPGGIEWREVYTSEGDAEAWLRAVAAGRPREASLIPTKRQRNTTHRGWMEME